MFRTKTRDRSERTVSKLGRWRPDVLPWLLKLLLYFTSV